MPARWGWYSSVWCPPRGVLQRDGGSASHEGNDGNDPVLHLVKCKPIRMCGEFLAEQVYYCMHIHGGGGTSIAPSRPSPLPARLASAGQMVMDYSSHEPEMEFLWVGSSSVAGWGCTHSPSALLAACESPKPRSAASGCCSASSQGQKGLLPTTWVPSWTRRTLPQGRSSWGCP